MEFFIVLHGSRSDVDILRDSSATGTALTEDVRNSLLRKYFLRFWYDSIKLMHEINPKCTRPLVFLGMLQEYRGLSRMGRLIGHMMGMNLDLRTYDRLKKKLIEEYLEELQATLNKRDGTFAFDNYAHTYRGTSLSVSRETQYYSGNYTVVGLVTLPVGHKIPKETVYLPLKDNRIGVASLPSELIWLRVFEKKVRLLWIPAHAV